MQLPGAETLQLIGSILLAIALPVLAWAVLGDTARGRLRCPKCWYRMEGIPKQETGWVCPECGRRIATERGLRRARRRWRWAVPALLAIVVASQLWQQPARANERWQTRWIPMTALVIAPTRVAWLECVNGAARARRNEMPAWVWLIVDWRDWRHATKAVTGLPYTRDQWPVGAEPVIWLQDADSIQGLLGARRDLTLEEVGTGRSWRYSPFYGYSYPIAGMSPTDGLFIAAPDGVGRKQCPVRLVISDGSRKHVVEQTVEYTAVGDIDAAIMPVEQAGFAADVRSSVQASWSGGGVLAMSMKGGIDWATFTCSILPDESGELARDDGGQIHVRMDGVPSVRLISLTDVAGPGARIIIRQDPINVLQRYPDATSYWPGAVEIPLAELLPP